MGTRQLTQADAATQANTKITAEAVICDLDGTLLRTNSFTLFVKTLLKRKPQLRPKLLWFILRRKLRLITHARAKQMILRSCQGHLTEEWLSAWSREILKKYANPEVAGILADYRARGCTSILATAAPELYATHIARAAHFDYLLATPMGGSECRGTAKRDRVITLLAHHHLRPVLFLTDHPDDLPLAAYLASLHVPTNWVK